MTLEISPERRKRVAEELKRPISKIIVGKERSKTLLHITVIQCGGVGHPHPVSASATQNNEELRGRSAENQASNDGNRLPHIAVHFRQKPTSKTVQLRKS